MEKRDFKRELRHLYGPSAEKAERVDVPAMNFLTVDGQGDPNTTPEYAQAVEALFSLSYALKFAVKKGPLAIDFGVMPLEGLWWADDMSSFSTDDRSQWKWTMMIMQPEVIDAELVESTKTSVAQKKPLPALDLVRFESFTEGLAPRPFTSAPSQLRLLPSRRCTPSSASLVSSVAASITRST